MKSYFILAMALLFFLRAYSQDSINKTDAKGLKQGSWVGKFEKGKKRYEGSFIDNKPNGLFTYYYESGEKNAELFFSGNGAKAKYFHLNGRLKGKGNYIDQKKDSTWLYYDDREILSQEENYSMGKKDGPSKIFYLDGTIAEEKIYRNGIENGPCKQYFQGGKLKYEAMYVDGNPDGKVNFYHPIGSLKSTGIYKDAVKDGEWISYNEDSLVYAREFYQLGVLKNLKIENGLFITRYEGGSIKEEYLYRDGKKNGIYKEYYEMEAEKPVAGDTSKKTMAEWETIYNDVKIFDDQHVPVTSKIKSRGNYVNDKPDGEVTHYRLSGEIEKVEIYEGGQLIKKKK